MPGPLASDLHVNQLLTNISIGYRNESYIADQIFPIVTVKKRSDIIPKYDQSHWFRDQAALRTAGTESKGGSFTVDTTDTYYCHRYSFKGEVDDEQRANADDPFSPDRDTTEFVTDKIQLRREKNFADTFFITGVWGDDEEGGSDFDQWDDYAASTPLVDVTSWMDIVEGLIAREPRALVIGKQVWSQVKWHPDVIDTIKYTQRGVMSEDLFASLLQLEQLLVGRAIFTSSAEGTAESAVTYSRVWGKHALLLYKPPRPSLFTPAAGYTFVWERVANAIQYIKSFRIEPREVDVIEGNSYFAQEQTAAHAGLFAHNVVS